MEITLKLLTDERVLELSKGEVKNFGKYLNYGYTPKPEFGGLFCQRIFGPVIDYTCDCGITKRVSNGEVCKSCGVPYLPKLARNERFGHIELNTYILPPLAVDIMKDWWGISKKALTAFIFETGVKLKYIESDKGKFFTPEGVRYALEIATDEDKDNIVSSCYDLIKVAEKLGIDPHLSMMENTNESAKLYFERGYHIFSALLTKFPVEPCGMRDRKKQGDDIVYHEDNLIYHRIIRDALRIKTFQSEVENEKEKAELVSLETRVIQNLINKMLYTGYKSGNKVEVASKVEKLNHKEGLLRANSLGKRIDFSGRSVITSGPFLKIDEVGIPIAMLEELFIPDLIRELSLIYQSDEGLSKISAIKKAKRQVNKREKDPIIWDLIIDKIAPQYMVMMNRAPSLHRFSVMSFRIRPTFDECLYMPPMSNKPFNHDNDGDQLAIYIMHSKEAMKEQRELLSYSHNLMSTVRPDFPNAMPSHEMVVGAYLLTNGYENDSEWKAKKIIKYYNNAKDVRTDLDLNYILRSDKICLKVNNEKHIITAGSALIYDLSGVIVDYVLGKSGISKLVSSICNRDFDFHKQVDTLSNLQTLFFETATKSGLSIAHHDCYLNPEYAEILQKARYEAERTPLTEMSGITVNGLEITKRAKIWDDAFSTCVSRWFKETPNDNALQLMGKAGARVTDVQVKAMILGKGLQSTMNGDVDSNAIYRGLNVGLDVMSYVKTCGPARKGFTQNAMIVPAVGYVTRQLVNCARDLSITTKDCGTTKGIVLPKRLALHHYLTDGTLVTAENLHSINDYVEVRSAFTCEHTNGLCSKCCGTNPKNGLDWDLNFGIGVSASQSVSEILQQDAMRGKHCQINKCTILDINGNKIRLKDVHKAVKRGHKIYVHSLNMKTGKFEVQKIKDVYQERWDDQYVKITYDNGETTRTTLDHPFINRFGKLVEAKDIQAGDSLMPMYSYINDDGYRVIKHNDGEDSESLGYHLSSEHYDFKSIYDNKGTFTRHHIDFTKTNDYPTNLLGCSYSQHIKLHAIRNHQLHKWGSSVYSNGFHSEEAKAKVAEHNREEWRRKLSGKVISNWSKENPDWLNNTKPFDYAWSKKQKVAFEQFKAVFFELHKLGWCLTAEKYREMHTQLFGKSSTHYKSLDKVLSILPKDYMSYVFPQGDKNDPYHNHKVVSVEIVKLPRKIPFYGIEVEGEWKNYPTGAGVMSHNTSGAISIKSLQSKVDSVLADIVKFLGGRSTQYVPLKDATITKSIKNLEGVTYEEKASNFIEIFTSTMEKAGINFSTVWYEVIGRSLSDIVFDGETPLGYRSKGYPCNDPKFQSIYTVNTKTPSWLKAISFGYTKSALKRAIRNCSSCQDLITERIIQGRNIING